MTAKVQYFIRLGDLAGGATAKGHEQEIALWAFSWGVRHPPSKGHSTGRAGTQPVPDELTFLADSSIASPRILAACLQGKLLPDAVLSARRAHKGGKGGSSASGDFLVITLTDVTVSGYEITAGPGEMPADEVTLAFERLHVELTEAATSAEASWNFGPGSTARAGRRASGGPAADAGG